MLSLYEALYHQTIRAQRKVVQLETGRRKKFSTVTNLVYFTNFIGSTNLVDTIVCPEKFDNYGLFVFERAVNNSIIAHTVDFFVIFVNNFIRLPPVTLKSLFHLGGRTIFSNELDHR